MLIEKKHLDEFVTEKKYVESIKLSVKCNWLGSNITAASLILKTVSIIAPTKLLRLVFETTREFHSKS